VADVEEDYGVPDPEVAVGPPLTEQPPAGAARPGRAVTRWAMTRTTSPRLSEFGV